MCIYDVYPSHKHPTTGFVKSKNDARTNESLLGIIGPSMKTWLVTGGAGFIGSHFVRLIARTYGDQVRILNVDKLTYAGRLENVADVAHLPSYRFIQADIADWPSMEALFQTDKIDYVVHFAAESHVDRSISDSRAFIQTNVVGTHTLLELSRRYGVEKFIHVSTDEVYGSLLPQEPAFTEENPLKPNSPYSASKAGSDLLARSYYETYKFPVIITRCSNNYGPYQFPEKLIPVMISQALNNNPLPVYGRGENIRDWLYVEDHCEAILAVLEKGKAGQVYNIGGLNEIQNLELVKHILFYLGKPDSLIAFVQDRLGHDMRYAIDNSKIKRELGWEPRMTFDTGLAKTIEWYKGQR